MKTRTATALKRPQPPGWDAESSAEAANADSDDLEPTDNDGTSTPPARKILKSLLTQQIHKALHEMEDELPVLTKSKHRAASLIPEFDPENEDCNIQTWLKKIDQLGEIHGWDEKIKSFYLQDKLRGQARKWYNRLEEYDFSWEEWKGMLLRAFPKHRDYANILEEMLNRKKLPTESMTKYYQEKVAMCFRCKLSRAATVSCIIRGLPQILQSNARAFKCDQPEELYEGFLCALDDYRTPYQPAESTTTRILHKEITRQGTEKKGPVNIETDPCPRCKKTGHFVRNCPIPDQRTCFKCGAQGHIAPRCPDNLKTSDKGTSGIKEIKLIQNYNDIYKKTAKVNGVYIKTYLDTGSQVNILCMEVAELLNLDVEPSRVVLKAFCGDSVDSKGEVKFRLQLDGLDMPCTAHLTDVKMNGVNLLIGQPVINSEGVILTVQNGTATLNIVEPEILSMDVTEENHRFKVTTATKECLPPGTSIIKVLIIGNRVNNDVVTPARHYDLHGVTYSLPATLLRGNEGYLKVVNTGSQNVDWKEGTVLLRAESCEEASIPEGSLRLFALLAALSLTSSSVVKTPSKNEGTFELLILHNNDMHARFEQTSQLSGACTTADRDAGKCYGGFPRVAHVVKEARAAAASGEGPPVLYLNAGDTYTGTAWFTIYKWKIAAEFLNALQPDAVSLGSNEFEAESNKLSSFVENLKPTILASNVIPNSLEGKRKIQKSIIFDINGKQVGIVGYLSLEDRYLDSTGSVEYIDEVIAVNDEVEKLKSQGINIIIALGYAEESKNIEIAKEVQGIDIVIAGHKNAFFWNGTNSDGEYSLKSHEAVIVTQSSGKQVPVVQSYAYSKYLGKLSINFDSEGEITTYKVNPILLDKSIPQDQEIIEIAAKYKHESVLKNEEVIGATAVVLDGGSCGIGECNLGNLITDAMMYIYSINFEGERWTDAPVAIINAGSIAASISPSNRPATITRGDLLAALPSESNIVAVTVNGTILFQILEHAVADYNTSSGNGQFLQYSGVRVVYDMSRESGSRVRSAIVRCWSCFVPEFFAIDDDRDYKILMPASLAQGGNGYSMLQGLPREDLVADEVTYVTEYIQMRSPVYPEISGRITLLNLEDNPEEPVDPEVPVTDSAVALSSTFTVLSIFLINLIIR